MIYLFENHNNDASIVYAEETLTEAQKAKGLAVEALPMEETQAGKYAVLKVNKAENKVWYEYVNVPKDETAELQQVITQMSSDFQALTDLLAQQGVI